jgi:hypothetical protein
LKTPVQISIVKLVPLADLFNRNRVGNDVELHPMLTHANATAALQLSSQWLGSAGLRPSCQPLNDFLCLGVKVDRQIIQLFVSFVAQKNLGHSLIV